MILRVHNYRCYVYLWPRINGYEESRGCHAPDGSYVKINRTEPVALQFAFVSDEESTILRRTTEFQAIQHY